MARTIETIYNRMIEAKEAKGELSGLTSSSHTAVWRLIMYICAVVIWSLESLFDRLRTEINHAIDTSRPGTVPWYYSQVLAYQHGDELVWDDVNFRYIYTQIDEGKQIIRRCAIQEGENVLFFKVSKLDGQELPVALTPAEVSAFTQWLNKIKFAGIRVFVSSKNADLVRPSLVVYYNRLVMKSDGTLISDGSTPVQDAISAYLAGIDYGGYINKTRLVDAIQEAAGVRDVVLTQLLVQPEGSSFQTVSGQNYYAESGAFKLESPSISFQPYNPSGNDPLPIKSQ